MSAYLDEILEKFYVFLNRLYSFDRVLQVDWSLYSLCCEQNIQMKEDRV